MRKKRKILIVDDTEINVELLADILREFRYDIATASDGIEALAAVDTHKPDMILLDVTMPRMDGFEVCERLKGNPKTEAIPIIIVTAQQDLPTKIRALEAGADDFLSKPFNKVELKARVKSLLRIVELKEMLDERNERIQELSGSKSHTIHGIIHDINPIISTLLAKIDSASKPEVTPEERNGDVEQVKQLSLSVQHSIRSLVLSEDKHKKMTIHTGEFSLRDLLKENISDFSKILKVNEKIVENIPPALPSISADRGLLSQVVTNLLLNALHHAKKGDKVISVSSMLDLKGNVQVTISDNGKGVPVDEMDSVFEKVEPISGMTIHTESGGGLTFCKMVIQLHGGKIGVQSTYGKGASFSFILPIK